MAFSRDAFRTWFDSFCGDKNGKITISIVDGTIADGTLTKVAGCYKKVSETLYERPDSAAALYYRDGAFCLNSEGHMTPHAPEFKKKMSKTEINCTEFKRWTSEDGKTKCEMTVVDPKSLDELDNDPKYTDWLKEQTTSVSPEDGCVPLWAMTASTKAAAGYREVQADALYNRATDPMLDDKWSVEEADKLQVMNQPDGAKCSYLARLNLIE